MARRYLSEKPLHVSEQVRGAELASPARRGVALAIDFVLLIVPTGVVIVLAAVAVLRAQDRPAYDAMRTLLMRASAASEERHAALVRVMPLLARLEAEGLPADIREAAGSGHAEEAAAIFEQRKLDLMFALRAGEFGEPKAGPGLVRVPLERLFPAGIRGVVTYGVAALYFTLLTSFGGRTLGKRMAGIRVARLDGHRLTLPESLERFAGYLHLPASLGLSLLDLWRDPNRRLPHDRVVHTAVLRVRRGIVARRAEHVA